jgi:folate-binding protein YgfZ
MPAVHFPSRQLIRVSGGDAREFLHSLITTDIESLPERTARPGALLTPHGKILFDFMISRDSDDFLIETDAAQRDALMRRLTMYKLRAAVTIAADDAEGVTVAWGGDGSSDGAEDAAFAKAGVTLSRYPGKPTDITIDASETDYETLRIASGIPASGFDYALQDAFPHDVLLDKTDGLSFRKGCYVGQEVVSRMQHRGTARRRVTLVKSDVALPASGTDIIAGGKPVGTLGSVSGTKGLAIVRIDRVGDAIANGVALTVGDVTVVLSLPEWSGLSFPTAAQEAET